MHPTLRRAVALPLLALLPLSGCTTWRTRAVPAAGSDGRLPDPVLVTRTDHSVLMLHAAVVQGDSIVGTTRADDRGARVAVALRDVERMEARGTDVLRTGAVVVIVGVVVLGVAAAYAISQIADY